MLHPFETCCFLHTKAKLEKILLQVAMFDRCMHPDPCFPKDCHPNWQTTFLSSWGWSPGVRPRWETPWPQVLVNDLFGFERNLGPPVAPFYHFFMRGGSPTKIDYRQKGYHYSSLSTGGIRNCHIPCCEAPTRSQENRKKFASGAGNKKSSRRCGAAGES